MKRSPKGHGCVTKLPTGKWLVKFPIGRNANGVTRYRTRKFLTKSEARRWQQVMIGLRESNQLASGPRLTLRKYAEEVLLNSNDRIADRTRDGYFRNLRLHAFPSFGSRPLADITSQELDLFFSQLRKTLSASTVNNVRIALSKVFTTAMRHSIVLSNPVARTEKAKRGELEPTQVCLPWTPDEAVEALEAVRGEPLELFVVLALSTGMRKGEILGLRWSDVDFDHGTVSIERTIHRESILQLDGSRVGRVVVAPPKTASSRRVNQLPKPVLEVLKVHQMDQDMNRDAMRRDWNSNGYILVNHSGFPLDESKVTKQWHAFLETKSLRTIRIHDLRHTFATILIEEDGGLLPSVSKALGHSSLAMTMDIYAKIARVDTQATSRMSEILFPGAGKITPIMVPVPNAFGSASPRWNVS